jgi:hypothetical protein
MWRIGGEAGIFATNLLYRELMVRKLADNRNDSTCVSETISLCGMKRSASIRRTVLSSAPAQLQRPYALRILAAHTVRAD